MTCDGTLRVERPVRKEAPDGAETADCSRMKESRIPSSIAGADDESRSRQRSAAITIWETADRIVDRERQRALMGMTDEEARQAFAQVLALWRKPEWPEPTSGLIELHDLLARAERTSRAGGKG